MPVISQRGPTGRASTLVVAASDASGRVRGQADYVCDGVDDQVEIQNAIHALPAAGGTVTLSEGTFVVAKAGVAADPPQGYAVLVDQNDGPVRLTGQGEATVVQLAPDQDADTCTLLIRGDSGDERTAPTFVSYIQFDGNDPNQSNIWTDYAIVEGSYADDITMFHCSFVNPTIIGARVFRDSERWIVDHCRFAVNDHVGLRTEMLGVNITNCQFVGENIDSGVLMTIATNGDIDVQGENILVSNCVFDRGLIQISTGAPLRCTIANNIFRNQTHNDGYAVGIFPYDHALHDYGAAYNVVAHNQMYNVRVGVYIIANNAVAALFCMYNIVHGNMIIEGPDVNLNYGVYEGNTYADYNVVEHNLIQGATAAVTTVGLNSVARDNVII